jgi:glycosyltransferase involved in cell wall biosynthesis
VGKISIVGTVGVPASYGGFETLAEQLVDFNSRLEEPHNLSIYCESVKYPERRKEFNGARLFYVPLRANGTQSVIYDIVSLVHSCLIRSDVVLLLGHGGSFIIPLLKLITKSKFITNIDGIEWRRDKWNWFARLFLRKSESFAVRFSDFVIADNDVIREYVEYEFGRSCDVIEYGGDHALAAEPKLRSQLDLPPEYALSLCRIEPENNVEMILTAFSTSDVPLVFVGNWGNSAYGKNLKDRFSDYPNIYILNPIYEPSELRAVRDRAFLYIHGHSAGGTNPALVEMMHFKIPILAHGCSFNRESTEDKAIYFTSAAEISAHLSRLDHSDNLDLGNEMYQIAQRRYTWSVIGKAYYDLIDRAILQKHAKKSDKTQKRLSK